ncbi:MAG: IMP dehydrogenase, partial [Bdellovibrionales bacterium]|nr:IMP dehydrogenase [Bdellovibrionales bacterium]
MPTKDFPLALTFDDILLIPHYSEILPSQVSPKSFFAKDLYLHSPIISSAMDTVTEHKMARVMAQMGGLGVIHKNLSPSEQAAEVDKVKKYESGMILDPITLGPEESVDVALDMMKKYGIGGIPITENKKFVGILTNRDVRYLQNTKQQIKHVMTKDDLVTAKVGVHFDDAKAILHKHRIEKLPIVDADGNLQGLITIKDIEKKQNFPQATKDSKGRLVVGAAVGATDKEIDRIDACAEKKVDLIVVDTAHGHSKNVLQMVEYIRKKYPDIMLAAGNVATEDGAKRLFEAGADVVKVGIGPGSICTTRVVCGVGVPQVTAIMACADIAK